MKLFVICSKKFYNRIPMIKEVLEKSGHQVFLPNCYDKPNTEDEIRMLGEEEHAKFKGAMYKQSEELINDMDGVLVLNLDKNGQKNYIGGATFLEMYDAFKVQKDIYLYNPIPSGILTDEIIGFNPTIINGNLHLIQNINKVQTRILQFLDCTSFKTINELTSGLKLDYDICSREVTSLCEKELATNENKIDAYTITQSGIEQLDGKKVKQLKI